MLTQGEIGKRRHQIARMRRTAASKGQMIATLTKELSALLSCAADLEEELDRQIAEEDLIPASNFCETLRANVTNGKLSDAKFRELAAKTLPIVR